MTHTVFYYTTDFKLSESRNLTHKYIVQPRGTSPTRLRSATISFTQNLARREPNSARRHCSVQIVCIPLGGLILIRMSLGWRCHSIPDLGCIFQIHTHKIQLILTYIFTFNCFVALLAQCYIGYFLVHG